MAERPRHLVIAILHIASSCLSALAKYTFPLPFGLEFASRNLRLASKDRLTDFASLFSQDLEVGLEVLVITDFACPAHSATYVCIKCIHLNCLWLITCKCILDTILNAYRSM